MKPCFYLRIIQASPKYSESRFSLTFMATYDMATITTKYRSKQMTHNVTFNSLFIYCVIFFSVFFLFLFCLFGHGPIMWCAWPLTFLSRRIHFKLRINVRIVCQTFLKNKRFLFPDPAVVIQSEREAGLIFPPFF